MVLEKLTPSLSLVQALDRSKISNVFLPSAHISGVST